MENHAYPYIGNKPIENIIRTDILNIIDRMNMLQPIYSDSLPE